MEMTLKLRTAAFGGFHRQDVVNYIESSTREHAAQLNALRAELKQARDELEELSGVQARARELSEQRDALARQVEALSPLEEEVAALRTQLEQAQARAEEYRPQAAAYARLKNTVAEIELDARTRSAQIIAEAEAEAGEKRAAAQALLDRITGEYATVGGNAGTAINGIIDQLSQLRSCMDQLTRLGSDSEVCHE